jgi:hypothetical protein
MWHMSLQRVPGIPFTRNTIWYEVVDELVSGYEESRIPKYQDQSLILSVPASGETCTILPYKYHAPRGKYQAPTVLCTLFTIVFE